MRAGTGFMKSTLKAAIVRSVFLTTLVLVAVVAVAIGRERNARYLTLLKQRAETLAHVVSDATQTLQHQEDLDRFFDRLGDEPGVVLLVAVADDPPRVIATTEPEWRRRRLDELPEAEVADDLREGFQCLDGRFGVHEPSKLLDYAQGFRGHIPVLGRTNEVNASLMIHLDYREVERFHASTEIILFVAGGLATLVLTGLTLGLIQRKVLNPLAGISEAVEARSHGDLGRRVPEDGGIEIATLARSLNNAFDAVDQTHASMKQSEGFIRTVLDLVPAMIWVKNPDDTAVLVNESRAKFLGGKPEEMVGRQGLDTVDCIESDRSFLRSKEDIVVAEEILRNSNGQDRWYITTRKRLVLANKQEQLVCVATDITERKHAEQRILASLRAASDLRSALNAAAIVAATDARGIITSVNDQFVEISGYSREELIGRDHRIVNSGCHPKEFFRNLWETISKGRIWRGEICNRTKGGQFYWLATTIVPLLSESGRPVQFIAIRHDVTSRRHAEAELLRSSALRRAIIENASHAIVSTDDAGMITIFNPAAERMLGVRADEIIGVDTPLRFFEARELATHAEATSRELNLEVQPGIDAIVMRARVGLPCEMEWTLVHRNGSRVPVWINVSRLVDPDGGGDGFIMFAADISARKKAETELARLNRELVDLSRMAGMSEVASSVLHNVGNVLNSVNVSVQTAVSVLQRSRAPGLVKAVTLLEEHRDDLGTYITTDPKGSRLPLYLSQAAREIARDVDSLQQEFGGLQKSVDHIKEVVSMQQGYARVGGVAERVAPSALIEDALRLNRDSMQRHRIRIVCDFGDVPEICTDRHKVLQILVNLMRNAKHACEDAHQEDAVLRFRTSRTETGVRVEVIDNGIGITTENLSKLFQHGFTTRKAGHGFGLHSAILAAKELGGSLSAASDGPGKGAVFTLELPLEAPFAREKKSV